MSTRAFGHAIQSQLENPNSTINKCGFSFPLITRINAGIALQRLHRDLNHHIPAYRQIARITLADWTCSLNKCINPISRPNHCKSQYPKLGRIPATWIIAQRTLQMCPGRFKLLSTDQSHIINGDVSIAHCLTLSSSYSDTGEKTYGHTLRTTKAAGLKLIKDIGFWEMDVHTGSTKFTQKPTLHSLISRSLNNTQ